jgi:hypothetical protein
MKRCSLIRANHELETHCKRTKDLTGSRDRWESISGIRSCGIDIFDLLSKFLVGFAGY